MRNASNIFSRFWKILGPGLFTGASDDDPSGIATYSQAGAAYGLSTLWTALISFTLNDDYGCCHFNSHGAQRKVELI